MMPDQSFPDSELRYTQQIEQQAQAQSRTQSTATPTATPPPAQAPVPGPSTATVNGNGGKRKDTLSAKATGPAGSGDEVAPPPKRRRQSRVPKEGDNFDDEDVGPGGGAKHWTVEEKTRLFIWILQDDERWEQFGSKMNVIFREVCSLHTPLFAHTHEYINATLFLTGIREALRLAQEFHGTQVMLSPQPRCLQANL